MTLLPPYLGKLELQACSTILLERQELGLVHCGIPRTQHKAKNHMEAEQAFVERVCAMSDKGRLCFREGFL
jgi:hypothetical protein